MPIVLRILSPSSLGGNVQQPAAGRHTEPDCCRLRTAPPEVSHFPEAICGNLAGHYVNYHTTQDPMGAVRGQLVGL
jgi:hypothetical protein